MSNLSLVSQPQRWQPTKISWWYDAIIDLMMANPQMTKKEIAEQLSCTPAAIYMITNSDIFKARFAQRRDALNSTLDGAIHSKLLAVADKSLGIIADILDKKRDAIPLPQLESLTDKVLSRLGYGAQTAAPPSPVVVNLNDNRSVVVPVSPSDLETARQALRRSESIKAIESRSCDGAPKVLQIQEIITPAAGLASDDMVEGEPRPLDEEKA